MNDFLQYALEYHEAGLKVIPAYEKSGGGYTFCANWKQYQESQTREQVEQLFSRPAWGVAILCTDGLEVIDIDTKHDNFGNIDKQYFDEVFWMSGDEKLLPTCTTQKTKSGGWHLIYKTDSPDGNQKLCYRPGEKEAIIETRGAGGLIFAYPTPGYEVKRGSLTDIQKISEGQRNTLIGAARQLSAPAPAEPKRMQKPEPSTMPASDELTPWDDYSNQHDVRDLIELHGWTQCRGGNSEWEYFTRPGGTKNTIHAAVSKNSNIFLPFTTSTQFDAEKGYTAYAVYTVLEHGGNFSASAKALTAQGYGRKPETKAPAQFVANVEGEQLSPFDYVMTTRFDINAKYEEPPSVLTFKYDGVTYDLAAAGEIVPFTGEEKSGKTFQLSMCAASALSGKRVFGWQLEPTNKRIIWLDCEQGERYYRRTQKRIFKLAGLINNPSNYEAYNLRRLSKRQRLEVIEQILSAGNIAYIFLDGIVDICENFNDVEHSERTVDTLLRWTDVHKATLFPVIHTAQGGWMKGHLGKITANKADTVVKNEFELARQVFRVSNPTARGRRFQMWEYKRDENGDAYLVDGYAETDDEPNEPEPQPAYNPNISPQRNDDDDIPF